jgi:predicted PhzF superfamily epimerase YddE/YHI9
MMEAVRTSETSVDNHFTRQYNPEDSSEHVTPGCQLRAEKSQLQNRCFSQKTGDCNEDTVTGTSANSEQRFKAKFSPKFKAGSCE